MHSGAPSVATRLGMSDGPRTWFVLGGGGSLGAFQAGALTALLAAGVSPDGFAGCSAGALNAAFLASDPSARRAEELAAWWTASGPSRILGLSGWQLLRDAARIRRGALLDERPLRSLIDSLVPAHDISELATPLSVTTTCLDCADARHHRSGPVPDLLLASCALPGLFAPVQLPDGHVHVDGGIVCGVPLAAALDVAGPTDLILVSDCGFAPVTGRDTCAASGAGTCGIPYAGELHTYTAPVERTRGPLDAVLRAFTAARSAANRGSVSGLLDDPRVRVLPHVADAWATGLLPTLPTGPRDARQAIGLVEAGRAATRAWLAAGLPGRTPHEPSAKAVD